jgi:signal transduction histidine kinase
MEYGPLDFVAKLLPLLPIQTDHQLRMIIEDDGRDLPENADGGVPAGLGMRSIRERVALLGGELKVQSSPGQGTTLIVALPFVREQ